MIYPEKSSDFVGIATQIFYTFSDPIWTKFPLGNHKIGHIRNEENIRGNNPVKYFQICADYLEGHTPNEMMICPQCPKFIYCLEEIEGKMGEWNEWIGGRKLPRNDAISGGKIWGRVLDECQIQWAQFTSKFNPPHHQNIIQSLSP